MKVYLRNSIGIIWIYCVDGHWFFLCKMAHWVRAFAIEAYRHTLFYAVSVVQAARNTLEHWLAIRLSPSAASLFCFVTRDCGLLVAFPILIKHHARVTSDTFFSPKHLAGTWIDKLSLATTQAARAPNLSAEIVQLVTKFPSVTITVVHAPWMAKLLKIKPIKPLKHAKSTTDLVCILFESVS